MKKSAALFLLLLICLPVDMVLAQTPIGKEMANAFYGNCKAQPAPNMSPDIQDLMCACTAATMMDKMSVEDLQLMSQTSNPNARIVFNKMMTQVYAPCIEFPAREHYYSTCISNPDTTKLTRNPRALCGCMADQVSGYLQQNAGTVLQEILVRDPTITDPMTAITNDPKFMQFAQSKLLGCVSK